MKVKRGDVIYLRKEFPMMDHIQGGNRPYVVVSNDIGNSHSEICMIVPLTSSMRNHLLPTHTIVPYNYSLCLCEQIFTVSQNDVASVKASLPGWSMRNIDRCLKIALGCGW